jgi:hypothetical protein
MAGLTELEGGQLQAPTGPSDDPQKLKDESLLRQIERIKASIATSDPFQLAQECGGNYNGLHFNFKYWGDVVTITWPELDAVNSKNQPYSPFDRTMLAHYLNCADGSPIADRWISFRELPGGGFYHRAFQGYSGDRLAAAFGQLPERFDAVCMQCNGVKLDALAPHAFAFQPLPRVSLAAVLWPGDGEFHAKGSILFDASGSHYLPIDGLAMLASALTRRLEKARREKTP